MEKELRVWIVAIFVFVIQLKEINMSGYPTGYLGEVIKASSMQQGNLKSAYRITLESGDVIIVPWYRVYDWWEIKE